ncbi:MAG TPA: hypothetical protein VMY05_00975 [Acidobacteriota bacterium]|nr:hypothetical protein [Acidobacteriota bacterium]
MATHAQRLARPAWLVRNFFVYCRQNVTGLAVGREIQMQLMIEQHRRLSPGSWRWVIGIAVALAATLVILNVVTVGAHVH